MRLRSVLVAKLLDWPARVSWTEIAPIVVGKLCLTAIALGWVAPSLAAEPSPASSVPLKFTPVLSPLDLDALKPGKTPGGVVTSKTMSSTYSTIPSLWWIAEQIASEEQFSNKLTQDWLAYPSGDRGAGRLDLVVNRQLWSLLDYLQRYEYINRFGAVARAYGYNIRVFDSQAKLVSAYTCDFSGVDISKLRTDSTPSDTSPATTGNTNTSNITTSNTNTASATRHYTADQLTCKMLIDTSIRANRRGIFTQPK